LTILLNQQIHTLPDQLNSGRFQPLGLLVEAANYELINVAF
jgi:hypothetical protein